MNELTLRPDLQQLLPAGERMRPEPALVALAARKGPTRGSNRRRMLGLVQPDDGFRPFRIY
jgi:hypothetical protein